MSNKKFKNMDEETENNLTFFEKEILPLNVEDPRFKHLIRIVKGNQSFDNKSIKILIALLIDIDREIYDELIYKLADLHEDDIREDERDMFVSILLCEVSARKKTVLDGLAELEITKPKPSPEVPKRESKGETNQEEQDDEELAHLDPIIARKVRKSTTRTKSSYLISKGSRKKTGKKTRLSFKERILSTLNEKKSFLIHQHAFPLPKGIKRIRIQKQFDEIVSFIKNYIEKTKLSVQIVVEDDRVKVIFDGKDPKRKPKTLYMRKKC
jgi:hypothetical protein